MSDTPSNAEIDADLALSIYDYDPRDSYPEFSHQDMREAWIAGYEAGRAPQNGDATEQKGGDGESRG
jgi:hypothetical protein